MAETKSVKSKRDEALERLRRRYPEEEFGDDESIFGRMVEDYDKDEEELGRLRGHEAAFAEMFASDPRSAQFLTEWRKGGDPAVALIRLYGEDIKEALTDPEKQEEIAAANKEYMKRVAKEKDYDAEYRRNLAASLTEIENAQKNNGLSDEQVDQAMGWVVTIAKDAMLGKFTAETIELAIKAQNYDTAVEDAAEEALVRGRNERVEEKLRRRKQGDGTAPLGGKNGQGGGSGRKAQSMFDLANEAM